MVKRILAVITVLCLVAAVPVMAATDIRIAASIGDTHTMNVVLSKVSGGNWSTVSNLTGVGMDFGELTLGGDNVYRSGTYFVVDAPVTSNHTSWNITHTRSDFQRDASNNLNNNVNVTFVSVNNTTQSETPLSGGYVSYANSNNIQYTNTQLANSRLRIYYGIASGSGDASGVTVITPAKPSGTYTGTVTLTLSP